MLQPRIPPKTFVLLAVVLLGGVTVFAVDYFRGLSDNGASSTLRSEWPVFLNPAYGYEMSYPQNWKLAYVTADYVGFSPSVPAEEDPAVEIVLLDRLVAGQSLQEWFGGYYAGEAQLQRLVNRQWTNAWGVSLLEVRSVPGISSDNEHTFFEAEGKVFVVRVFPYSRYSELYDAIISSVRVRESM